MVGNLRTDLIAWSRVDDARDSRDRKNSDAFANRISGAVKPLEHR